ncbi:MAG: hypothetical protein OEZ54_11485 [Gemmatimonadota bacterium]|nr:hypothetical protein [Gemmatimonadota bacterium]
MAPKILPLLFLAACGHQTSSIEDSSVAPDLLSRVSVDGQGGQMGNVEIHHDADLSAVQLSAPVDSVLDVVPTVFVHLGIPDVSFDPGRMVIGNPEFTVRRIGGERLSRYFDCGMGITAIPNADNYRLRISVLAQVLGNDTGTRLTVVVEAVGSPRSESGNPVRCQSTGMLEDQIISIVEEIMLTATPR